MLTIGDYNSTYVLTRLYFDPVQQSMNETINFPASVTVKGNRPCSIAAYSQRTLIICSEYKAILVDVDTLEQLKTVNINQDVEYRGRLIRVIQLMVPLISKHMIPDTDFKFMLECYDSQFIRLRTVETGSRQILIQATPKATIN